MKKFFFLVFIVLIWNFSFSVSFGAAIFEVDGKPVEKSSVSKELWDTVRNFELNSMPVVDSSGGLLRDIFINEDTTKNLGNILSGNFYFNNYDKLFELKNQKLAICPEVITYEQVEMTTEVLNCENKSYISLRKLEKIELNEFTDQPKISESLLSGEFIKEIKKRVYRIQFQYKLNDLKLRQFSLDKLISETKKQVDAAQKQVNDENDKVQIPLNAIAKQAVMLDDSISLPVEDIASFLGFEIRKYDFAPDCITVEEPENNDYKLICDEVAWGLTNFVSKIVSKKIFSPLIAINDIFNTTTFTFDSQNNQLVLKYISKNNEFRSILPAKLPLIKTVTRSLIFPYTADSLPKCSTSTIKRKEYTLLLTSSRPYTSLDFKLQNNSGTKIVVIWDGTSLRLPNGSSSGIIHDGTRFSDRSLPQANTPVSPRALLDEILVAKSTIYYSESLKDWAYNMFGITATFDDKRNSLFVSGSTQTVSGSIALQVNGKKVYEQFSVTCKAKTGEYRK